MPRSITLCGLSALAFMAATATAAAAPSFDGVWVLRPGQAPGLVKAGDPPAPLTAKGRALYDARRKAMASPAADPDPVAKCLPMGFPRNMAAAFPMEIVSNAHKVSIIFPSSIRVRRVFTDRQAHSDEIDPQFNGDSIGHWQGGSLIVDTVGFLPNQWLDGAGLPESPSAHITEQLRLLQTGVLEDRITIEDPENYARVWTATKLYVRGNPAMLTDGLCEELSVDRPDWSRRAN